MIPPSSLVLNQPSVSSVCFLTSAPENSLAARCWKPISQRPGEADLLSGLAAPLPGLAAPLPGLAAPLPGLTATLPGLTATLPGLTATPGSETRTETGVVTRAATCGGDRDPWAGYFDFLNRI